MNAKQPLVDGEPDRTARCVLDHVVDELIGGRRVLSNSLGFGGSDGLILVDPRAGNG